MRRILSVLVALLVLCSLALPVLAQDFVPSITYKPEPDLEQPIRLVDEDKDTLYELDRACLEITSVGEALAAEKAGTASDADELLLDVYRKLDAGTMKLPKTNLVVRHLIDASLVCGDVHTDPSHVEELAKPGVYAELTFDLGVSKTTKVTVYAYVDGKWVEAECVNNKDGTVTCYFEDICPIAFCVPSGTYDPPAKTGDVLGQYLWLWILLLALSLGAIVVLVVLRNKKK